MTSWLLDACYHPFSPCSWLSAKFGQFSFSRSAFHVVPLVPRILPSIAFYFSLSLPVALSCVGIIALENWDMRDPTKFCLRSNFSNDSDFRFTATKKERETHSYLVVFLKKVGWIIFSVCVERVAGKLIIKQSFWASIKASEIRASKKEIYEEWVIYFWRCKEARMNARHR